MTLFSLCSDRPCCALAQATAQALVVAELRNASPDGDWYSGGRQLALVRAAQASPDGEWHSGGRQLALVRAAQALVAEVRNCCDSGASHVTRAPLTTRAHARARFRLHHTGPIMGFGRFGSRHNKI